MAQHNRATRSIDRQDSQPTVRPLPGHGPNISVVPPLDADNLDRVFDRLAELLASGAPSPRKGDSAPAGKGPQAAPPISPRFPKPVQKPPRPATHNKILEPQARPEDMRQPGGDLAQPSNDVHRRTTLRAPHMEQEPRSWPTAKVIRLLQPPLPEIDPASVFMEPMSPIEVKIVDTELAPTDEDSTATVLPPSKPGRSISGEPAAERRSRPSSPRSSKAGARQSKAPSTAGRSFGRILAGGALLVMGIGAIASWLSSPVETAPAGAANGSIPQETVAVAEPAHVAEIPPAPSAAAIEAPPVSSAAAIEAPIAPAPSAPAALETKPLKSAAIPPLPVQRPLARAKSPGASTEKPPAPPVTPPAPAATAAPPKGRILD